MATIFQAKHELCSADLAVSLEPCIDPGAGDLKLIPIQI